MLYEVEVPLPPIECSGNYRGHTLARARPVAIYRDVCAKLYTWSVASGFLPKAFRPPVWVSLAYYLFKHPQLKRGRFFPKDEDSARFGAKTAQDALMDAGLIPDDNHRVCKNGTVDIFDRPEEHNNRCCLVMIFEEAGA